jgi:hypothetical protein
MDGAWKLQTSLSRKEGKEGGEGGKGKEKKRKEEREKKKEGRKKERKKEKPRSIKEGEYGWGTFYTCMKWNIETCQSHFKKGEGEEGEE